MIRILHISDFHYERKHKGEYGFLIKKLCAEVANKDIDLIVFSGDLTYNGKSEKDYNDVSEMLLTPLLEATKLSANQFLIVPGNHDVDLEKEIDVIIEKNGKLYPIEIKKSTNPDKNAVKNFSLIPEDKLGEGCVICLSKEDYPINKTVNAIPVGYI